MAQDGGNVTKKEKVQKEAEEALANNSHNMENKYEIAEELGLLDRVLKDGWGSLTAQETGKIGGILAKKRKGN